MELAVAILAAVVALGSLGWQAYEWRGSKARPVVEAIVFRKAEDPPVLRVEVRNSGRSACQLIDVHLLSATGDGAGRIGFDPAQYLIGSREPLPVQIEPGNSLVLDYRASSISRALAHHGETEWKCKLWAEFGDGTHIESVGTLTLGEFLDAPDEFTVDHGTGIKSIAVFGSTSEKARGRRDGSVRRLLHLNEQSG